jgi:acyl-CoA thioesterase-1
MKNFKLLLAGTFMCIALVTQAQNDKVKIFNRGKSGETSGEGLKRFSAAVTPLKADWLIIYYGINDSLFTKKMVTPEKFAENMQKLIDKAKLDKIKHIVLVTINPVVEDIVKPRKGDHPHKDNLNAYVEKFDRKVRELAKKNNLMLFDLRKMIIDNGGPTKSLVRNKSNGGWNDGLHLTPQGYKMMAEKIYQMISPELKNGETIVCLGDSITYGAHTKGQGTVNGECYPGQLNKLLQAGK